MLTPRRPRGGAVDPAGLHLFRRHLTRVFFCNSGTESIEGAIKFARCYTRKPRVLFCDHAFHGLTVGSLSLNGSDFFRERFGQLMPGAQKIAFNDLPALEQALQGNDRGRVRSGTGTR